ncbi:GerAB/ArcD/ProY family transporter [Tepidibacter aestuarii]|uniref:GerAB/ArcD/ProY family transporter n=1 Tax=Tepidibacter aestuarii TaxID=2925782 RepID=UPI0020BD7E8E|nr:endospore germination permease [Tepidibacter aestuarii]CAH2213171.1 Spore germination protein GerKB [Tepidibacter aestuarii]
MNKEVISDKQGIAILFLFLVGGSSIYAQGIEAKQDIWLAFILGILLVFPMTLIFARLHHIFPDKDLFDIVEICFGKFIGKIIIILYTWFAFFLASDILVTYGQFIKIISFPEMPQIIPEIVLAILCIWGIKEGIEVLGRFSGFFLNIPIITLVIIIILLIPNMDINNFRPVLSDGIQPVLEGTFTVFTFPLVQLVVFTMIFSNFETNGSPYKVYTTGLLTGGTYLALLSITNLLVLGIHTVVSSYYPTYTTISRINIGFVLQRIEIIITITFILGGFIKICIFLLSMCKGITKLFGFIDYRFIITPASLLVLNLSYNQYKSVMYYYEFSIHT